MKFEKIPLSLVRKLDEMGYSEKGRKIRIKIANFLGWAKSFPEGVEEKYEEFLLKKKEKENKVYAERINYIEKYFLNK